MLKNLFQKQDFKEVAIANGVFTVEQAEEIENNADAREGLSFVALVSREFGNDAKITSAITEFAGVQVVPLRELPKISPDILNEIPRQIISGKKVFPYSYGESRDIVKVAMADPTDKDTIENLEIRTNKRFDIAYGTYDDIDFMISKYFGSADALEAADLYQQTMATIVDTTSTSDMDTGDSPIITIVNSLLEQAAKMKASDIHIEPFDTVMKIRYRVDGALVARPSFPISMHSAIIARLKVMGGMDISEKRIPQDGRITFMVEGIEYDIRVSMLPTVYGEKCVMRLALRANLQRDKKNLGLTDYDLKLFDKIFQSPNGIILVTGPTGSGKSTTLYTALSELSTEEVNVVTVEDPVEANVEGVNQVQTNAKAGLTFASALRSILRQDPDIIMIGEIRDEETAEIAVSAAITGHLVVSTLHTNSASATITRMINMGLPPYLVADSVIGILAQRLVRRLCPKCKKEKMATAEDKKELGIKPEANVKIYEKGGCAYCNNTGYQGRIAVYEIMDVTPEIKEMIVSEASSADIKKVAVSCGMHTLHRSAAELVIRGITTMQEMRKVSNES